jgi:hypothetical protein
MQHYSRSRGKGYALGGHIVKSDSRPVTITADAGQVTSVYLIYQAFKFHKLKISARIGQIVSLRAN